MSQESEDFSHLIGSTLADKYRINALLGMGGMGAVFDGEHVLMHKRVAIKLLLPELSQTGEVVARFEREAMAAANIDHPNVVKATDFGKLPDGSFYLVLEFVEGRNLRQLLAYGALPPDRSLRIIEQVASALAKAHDLGIVHRDLKPENVMLVRKDNDPDYVKVLDFGIAKVPVEALSGQELQTGQGLTRMGVMYGTPEYMAPEQAMGTGVDHRADLYALGVMLFEMVTGARPFDAENVVSLVTMHIVEPPPTLAERLPPGTPLPEGLEALVATLLEKDRDKRIQSARDLAEQSRRVLGVSTPPSQAAPSSSWNNGAPSGAVPSGYTSTGVLGNAPTSAGVVPSGAPAVASAATAIEASPATHNLPIGYVPTAQIAPGEPRWRSELQAAIPELEQLRARLPGPLARLPLVAFPAAFGALLLLIIVVLAWPRGSTETTTPGATSSAPASPGLTDAQIDEARGAGIPALETLAERFPKDGRVQRALLKAYHEARRPGDAVKTLAKLAETQKNLLSEELVLEIVKSAVAGPSEASEAMFTLLETGFGAEGVEVLYALWTDKKDVGEKTRVRAGKSLAKPEVKDLAMKPTRVLIDLRAANAGCESKRAAVAMAQEAGDARAVPLMQSLTSTKGCGILGRFDCWPCLRNGNLLNNAIKAAEKRPAP